MTSTRHRWFIFDGEDKLTNGFDKEIAEEWAQRWLAKNPERERVTIRFIPCPGEPPEIATSVEIIRG